MRALSPEAWNRILGYLPLSRDASLPGDKLHKLAPLLDDPSPLVRRALADVFASAQKAPRVVALHDAVAARPRIAAYLASPRRQAFNEHGIFRHYPELDG